LFGDGAVVAVGVAVHLLRITGIDHRIDGQEPAVVGVVLPAPSWVRPRVESLVPPDEAPLPRPVDRVGAARRSVRRVVALGDLIGGRVDGAGGGALPVVGEDLYALGGPDRDGGVAPRV
jgi:hypothetical protein